MGRTAVLLLLCFVLAQADKQVIGLIAEPLRRSLRLSDGQLGLVQGAAFAIGFAVGGLPIARLVDTGNRIRVAAGCVVAWSIATIASGFAPTFGLLVLSRAFTAFAEAGLPPAAFSIFSSANDRRLVAKLTGIFMLAPYLGGGLVLLGGGLLLHVAGSTPDAWRWVLLAIGVPGLLLAPVLLAFGFAPPREVDTTAAPAGPNNYRQVLAEIFVRRPLLRNYYLGLALFYVGTAAMLAWFPGFLVRVQSLSAAEAGAYAGITFLVAGVGGTIGATAVLASRDQLTPVGVVRIFFLLSAVAMPTALLLPLAHGLIVVMALYALYAFISAAILSAMPIPLQLALSPGMRARGIAVLSLIMSAGAGSAGPLIVGLLSDHTGLQLSGALSAVGAASSAAAALLFLLAGRVRFGSPELPAA